MGRWSSESALRVQMDESPSKLMIAAACCHHSLFDNVLWRSHPIGTVDSHVQ
jgi:hypothetical protein